MRAVADQLSDSDLLAADSVASASGILCRTQMIHTILHTPHTMKGMVSAPTPIEKYKIVTARQRTTLTMTDRRTTRPSAHWITLNHRADDTLPTTADTTNMPEQATQTVHSTGSVMSGRTAVWSAPHSLTCVCWVALTHDVFALIAQRARVAAAAANIVHQLLAEHALHDEQHHQMGGEQHQPPGIAQSTLPTRSRHPRLCAAVQLVLRTGRAHGDLRGREQRLAEAVALLYGLSVLLVHIDRHLWMGRLSVAGGHTNGSAVLRWCDAIVLRWRSVLRTLRWVAGLMGRVAGLRWLVDGVGVAHDGRKERK